VGWFSRRYVAAETHVALLAAEYESVRAESIESFRTAQSIIQWTLASYGVLFGAGFLTMQVDIAPQFRFTADLGTVVIFAALPGLVTAATWQWLGEITRMERAGAYLRGLEAALRKHRQPKAPWPYVLNWETYLRGTTSKGAKRDYKRHAPYLGTAMMFGGITAVPLVLSGYLQTAFLACHHGQGWWQPIFWVWDIGIAVTFLTVSITLGLDVVKLGSKRYDAATDGLVRL
jgi:hypothetical protein